MLATAAKNCKFIATETSNRIGITDATTQSFGNDLEQLVTDRMSERIIDVFETVQVEEENCHLRSASDRSERFVKVLSKSRAVEQARNRVMVSHIGDLFLGLLLLCNVLNKRD